MKTFGGLLESLLRRFQDYLVIFQGVSPLPVKHCHKGHQYSLSSSQRVSHTHTKCLTAPLGTFPAGVGMNRGFLYSFLKATFWDSLELKIEDALVKLTNHQRYVLRLYPTIVLFIEL
jgi:hypothetical protein